MSISSPDDVDYIDTESPLIAPKMEEESSSIETVYTPSEKVKIRFFQKYSKIVQAAIKQRLEQLRSSPSYDALLSIQRMAKLCQVTCTRCFKPMIKPISGTNAITTSNSCPRK